MSQSRSKKSNPLKPPEIKRVESPILKRAQNPGGPYTPGAKKKRAEEEAKKK